MWMCIVSISNKGCRGCDRMVVEFITTNVISAYRCSNPAQARCTRYNTPVSYTTKTVRQRYSWNIVESGVKHHNPNPNLTILSNLDHIQYLCQHNIADKNIWYMFILYETSTCNFPFIYTFSLNIIANNYTPIPHGR